MGKVLQHNYQNYAKIYLVQTRSQSKAKNARPSDTCTPLHAKAVEKVRKEIKPIVIDDDDNDDDDMMMMIMVMMMNLSS